MLLLYTEIPVTIIQGFKVRAEERLMQLLRSSEIDHNKEGKKLLLN